MEFLQTTIPGVFLIKPKTFFDERGSFVKHFNGQEFQERGLVSAFHEDFFSISQKNVVRGFHFQTPPHDHAKLVYCSQGKVFDVLLDLRVGSPTYGKTETFFLDAKDYKALYIPSGVGHAFASLEDNSLVMYKVSSGHHPDHDKGVHWESVGLRWPVENAIVSKRDISFPALGDYQSPFKF